MNRALTLRHYERKTSATTITGRSNRKKPNLQDLLDSARAHKQCQKAVGWQLSSVRSEGQVVLETLLVDKSRRPLRLARAADGEQAGTDGTARSALG